MRGFVKAALVLALAATSTPAMARVTEVIPFDTVKGWNIRYSEGSTACHMSKTDLDSPFGIVLAFGWDAEQDMATVIFATKNEGRKLADNGTAVGIQLFDKGDSLHPNESWQLPSAQISINGGNVFFTGSFADGSAFLDDVQKSHAFALHSKTSVFIGGFMLDGIAAAVPRLRQCAESQLRMWGAK